MKIKTILAIALFCFVLSANAQSVVNEVITQDTVVYVKTTSLTPANEAGVTKVIEQLDEARTKLEQQLKQVNDELAEMRKILGMVTQEKKRIKNEKGNK